MEKWHIIDEFPDYYVSNYLMQAIRESNSGWENVKYKLLKRDEYIHTDDSSNDSSVLESED